MVDIPGNFGRRSYLRLAKKLFYIKNLMGVFGWGNLLGFLGILKYYLVWLHLSGGNLDIQGNVASLSPSFCWECGFLSLSLELIKLSLEYELSPSPLSK
jgi:hypothetical protein